MPLYIVVYRQYSHQTYYKVIYYMLILPTVSEDKPSKDKYKWNNKLQATRNKRNNECVLMKCKHNFCTHAWASGWSSNIDIYSIYTDFMYPDPFRCFNYYWWKFYFRSPQTTLNFINENVEIKRKENWWRNCNVCIICMPLKECLYSFDQKYHNALTNVSSLHLPLVPAGINRTSVPCYINRHNIWIIGGQFACILWKYDAFNGKWILEGANLAELFYSSWNNNIFKYCVSARQKCIAATRERAKGSYLWEKSTNWKLNTYDCANFVLLSR